jgi:hypothetical protein
LFESRVNLPQKAQVDAIEWCNEIRRLLAKGNALTRQSFFWPEIGQSTSPSTIEVQLFWLTDQGWSHENSVRSNVEAGRHLQLVFEIPAEAVVHGLRFDPMNCPGIVVIHSLKVWLLENENQVLWSGTDRSLLQQLRPGGDSLVDEDAAEFRVVSLGEDPQLYLQSIGKPAGKIMRVEVAFTCAIEPSEQIACLRKNLLHLKQIVDASAVRNEQENLLAAIGRDVTETQEQVSSVNTRLESFAKLNESSFSDLVARLAPQKELELKLRETENGLASLRSLLPERDRQITFAREALLGHARTIDRLELLRDKLLQSLEAADVQAKAQTAHIQAGADQNGRLAQELAGAREKISALTDQINTSTEVNSSHSAEIVSLKNTLESVHQREMQSAATLASLAKNIASLETTLARAEEENRQWEIDLSLEKKHRHEMETTLSWRWTSWLRQLGRNKTQLRK